MKKIYLFWITAFFILNCSTTVLAQMTGTSVFLQGQFLEIGVAANGSFGPGPAPAGYHPYAGTNLAMVYDYGHNGWAASGPATPAVPWDGDYTYPGTPFDGWCIQVNGARGDAFYTTGGSTGTSFTPAASWTGTGNVSYTNVGGIATGLWIGNFGGLKIRQYTRVDAGASWAVVTVVMTNTTAAALPNIYYWRTCDPDNDETRAGSFITNNYIVYQNDVDHRVMVSADGTYNSHAWMALGTKDCRAKSLIYELWAPYPAAGDLAQVYNQTATSWLGSFPVPVYNVGGSTLSQDIAIGLIYNVGTVAAGDSAVISYAYMFGNGSTAPLAGNAYTGANIALFNNSIDSAFPEPLLVVNGVSIPPTGAAPAPTRDTFHACGSGLTTLNVNIKNATDKNWTWSTWTWSPGTGLGSTTGTTNTINLTGLPPIITYTITGTDSSIDMHNCANRTMYLTILTCNGAVANSPCWGDTLKFNAPGDSTGASYVWYGPDPSTAIVGTTQGFYMYPATWADTGVFHVIKTVGAVHDTAFVHVTINPKPTVTASSNSPLGPCFVDTLLLNCIASPLPVTYAWTGPAGFVSGIQNPVINTFTAANAGTYQVIVTTPQGCKDTATTNTTFSLPPAPPVVTAHTPYCQFTGYSPAFTIVTAVGTVWWYPTSAGVGGSTTPPVVNTSVPGTFWYYFNQVYGSCTSPIDSVSVTIKPRPPAPTVDTAQYCADFANPAALNTMVSGILPGGSLNWYTASGSLLGPTTPNVNVPVVMSTPTYPGYDVWWVSQIVNGCEGDSGAVAVRIVPQPIVHIIDRGWVCQFDSIQMSYDPTGGHQLIDSTYMWTLPSGASFANGTMATDSSIYVTFDSAGQSNYVTLTVSNLKGECTASDTVKPEVIAIPTATASTKTEVCMSDTVQLALSTKSTSATDFVWMVDATPLLNSTALNIISANSNTGGPYSISWVETGIHVIHVQAFADHGCTDKPTSDTVDVHAVPDATFNYTTFGGTLCLEDSVLFAANDSNYQNSYQWAPAHFFNNLDKHRVWGRVELEKSIVTLTVTDPFGCRASSSQELNPSECCNVPFPNAFTPNGDGWNDVFRPIPGRAYHRFHIFRVQNRWGQTIFECTNNKAEWDGTFNGVPQDLGVYYWYLKYDCDGKTVEEKGDVTLVR